MDISKYLNNDLLIMIVKSLFSILISIIIYNVFVMIIGSSINRDGLGKLSTKKKATYLKMLKSIIRYVLIVINVLVILKIFGINITSMLAGVGIIGIILGFAVQDALKDIIKGIDIIADNYYQVGDVIKYEDITGKVISIGLKTTKLEDVNTFNIVSISNRNIEKVEVVSNLINIDVPISYEVSLDKAEKVINDIVESIKKHEGVNKCEYRGVNDLADSSIKYQIKVYCNPVNKVQIRRDSLRYILVGLDKHHLSVPYNQIDVHQK